MCQDQDYRDFNANFKDFKAAVIKIFNNHYKCT